MAETNPPPAEIEELYSSWALLILTVLLIGAMWTSYYLQVRKITAIHETVISIMTGMIIGFIIRVAPGTMVQDMVTFRHTYFFNLLLPPIILNSGYEMKQARFFRNLGTILTFAFVGTFISALVVGVLVYLLSLTGLESLQLSFLDSMIFGSVLSATDPVTILAIFNQLKVDPKLYSVIFGESILNDAVSIVMFETLKKYRGEDFHLGNVLHGVSTFFFVFIVSLMIGAIIGLVAALGLKRTNIHLYPGLESCLIALMAYASYFFSNSVHLSGIVSLLFCGITLKHYAYESMSLRSKRTTKSLFQVLAQLSENFIFIYLGLTLFTEMDLDYKPLFIMFTFIFICISRYSAVFPLSSLINMVSVYVFKRSDTLSRPHQVMLFWAGLRGAVAFALAAGLDGVEEAPALKTTILVVVVLSVIVFGGTTARMLAILGVKVGCIDSEGESDEDEHWGEDYDRDREIYLSEDVYGRGNDSQALYMQSAYSNSELSLQSRPSDDEFGGGSSSGSGSSIGSGEERLRHNHSHRRFGDSNILPLPVATANHPDDTHWFLSFDDRYLKPIFSRSRQWNKSRRKFSGPTLHHHRNFQRSQKGQPYGQRNHGGGGSIGGGSAGNGDGSITLSSGMTTATSGNSGPNQFGGRHSRFASANGSGTVASAYLTANANGSSSNLTATNNNNSTINNNNNSNSNRKSSADTTLSDEMGMSHVRRELDRRAAAGSGGLSHSGSSHSLSGLGGIHDICDL
ncbi:monovalent cation:H+ antiporter, CPA1 (nhx1) [Podila humilis]|nr:monovalent cation:H+ antiporter, CPA1 (nhx1) [Podila humilis]